MGSWVWIVLQGNNPLNLWVYFVLLLVFLFSRALGCVVFVVGGGFMFWACKAEWNRQLFQSNLLWWGRWFKLILSSTIELLIFCDNDWSKCLMKESFVNIPVGPSYTTALISLRFIPFLRVTLKALKMWGKNVMSTVLINECSNEMEIKITVHSQLRLFVVPHLDGSTFMENIKKNILI